MVQAVADTRIEQLRLHFKAAPLVLCVPIIAAVSTILLWPEYDHALLLPWAALLSAHAAASVWIARRFERRPRGVPASPFWTRWVLASALGTGLLWGAFGLGFYQPAGVEERGFVLFVLATVVAGGVLYYGLYLPACIAYVLSATLPLAIAMLAHGTLPSFAMGGMLLVSDTSMIAAAVAASQVLSDVVGLQVRNAALVDDLRGAKNAADHARDAAEEASRVKSRFVANMSHELRTPLNAIIGFSEILRGVADDPASLTRFRSYAEDINASGRHLLELVNDILDMSKIEAGGIELAEAEVDVAKLILATVRLVRAQAEQKRLKLTVDLSPGLPPIYADDLRLKQALVNLLSNAIKFTDAGGAVAVRAGMTAAGDLRFVVRDNGSGMDPETIPLALEAFRQIDNDHARRYAGTGLGLPLAKSFIEQHGGTLSLESAPGAGTTAIVVLPGDRVMAAPAKAQLTA